MNVQSSPVDTALAAFDLLVGTWRGEGQGVFPTIDAFDYRETSTFVRRDETTLFYDQRTEKQLQGEKSFHNSHWESGFLRILENGNLELTNSQSGGRAELLEGHAKISHHRVILNFTSLAIVNDSRMVASARRWEVDVDTFRYLMEMHTTKVDTLTPHLSATLRRVT